VHDVSRCCTTRRSTCPPGSRWAPPRSPSAAPQWAFRMGCVLPGLPLISRVEPSLPPSPPLLLPPHQQSGAVSASPSASPPSPSSAEWSRLCLPLRLSSSPSSAEWSRLCLPLRLSSSPSSAEWSRLCLPLRLSSATKCTTPSLIPTVNGNTARSFSTDGQQSAAKGSSTAVSRSDIRLIQYLDSSALWFGPEVALNWLFPYPLLPLSAKNASA
jgi:hypothetical protein